jgi:hypothetical protein
MLVDLPLLVMLVVLMMMVMMMVLMMMVLMMMVLVLVVVLRHCCWRRDAQDEGTLCYDAISNHCSD